MSPPIAYLAQSKLYLQKAENQFREIKSEFGQSIQRQRLQVQRRNAWKDRGIRSMMMSPQAMAQLEQQAEAVVPVTITSLCNAGEGKLFYTLEAGRWALYFDSIRMAIAKSDYFIRILGLKPRPSRTALWYNSVGQ